MKPDQVTALTDLASLYADSLKSVSTPEQFKTFLQDWYFWLDPETRQLSGQDWPKLKNLIADCRKEDFPLNGIHGQAISLVMPYKIGKISLLASYFGTTWGYTYLELKGVGSIDF